MKKLLLICSMLVLCAGCVTISPADPRPPLMDNSNFTDYEPYSETASNYASNFMKKFYCLDDSSFLYERSNKENVQC